MGEYMITWVSVYRVFRVADKLISQGGYLSDFDKNTYRYLFEQLGEDEKGHLLEKFGDNLNFLNE